MTTTQEVVQAYSTWYSNMLRKGTLPLRSTTKGFWAATPSEPLLDLFPTLKLSRFTTFCDLGSGDGKVVLLAALNGLHADGIEHDTELHTKAVRMKQQFWLNNVTFHNKDYYTHNISNYDIIYLNPDQSPHRGLDTKLKKELTGHLIVFGGHFHPQLTKHNDITLSGYSVAHYTHPERTPPLPLIDKR